MSTEIHAVEDEPFNGNSGEHDTNPGSRRAIAKKLETIAEIVGRADQRAIDTQDMVRGLAVEVGNLRSDVQKRLPPYALWVLTGCAVLMTLAALWSVFGRGGA